MPARSTSYYLTPRDIRSGNALATALFGKNPKQALHEYQLDDGEYVAKEEEAYLPDKMDVRVSGFKQKDYTGTKWKLIRPHMEFGGRAVFTTNRQAAALIPIARYVYALLLARSTKFLDKGFYRSQFTYLVNGVPKDRLIARDVEEPNTVLAVANKAEYAGTLESPDRTIAGNRWPRPFYHVFKAVERKYGTSVDLRYRYVNSDQVGGPTLPSNRGRVPKPYATPIIEIAEFGVLRTRGISIIARRNPKYRKYAQYNNRNRRRRT